MIDNAGGSALLLALFPIIAVLCLSLNLLIRARGGRSFTFRIKGFGIDMTVESVDKHSLTPSPPKAHHEVHHE